MNLPKNSELSAILTCLNSCLFPSFTVTSKTNSLKTTVVAYENQLPSSQLRKQNGFCRKSPFLADCHYLIFVATSEKFHSQDLFLFDSELTMTQAVSSVYLSETISGNGLTWQWSEEALRVRITRDWPKRLKKKNWDMECHMGLWNLLMYS